MLRLQNVAEEMLNRYTHGPKNVFARAVTVKKEKAGRKEELPTSKQSREISPDEYENMTIKVYRIFWTPKTEIATTHGETSKIFGSIRARS